MLRFLKCFIMLFLLYGSVISCEAQWPNGYRYCFVSAGPKFISQPQSTATGWVTFLTSQDVKIVPANVRRTA